MRSRYDAIVIGAGHNGLVAAAYLARHGLATLSIERNDRIGGACITDEIMPGYRVSGAAQVLGMLRPQVVQELELERHGLRYRLREPEVFGEQLDGVSFAQGDGCALDQFLGAAQCIEVPAAGRQGAGFGVSITCACLQMPSQQLDAGSGLRAQKNARDACVRLQTRRNAEKIDLVHDEHHRDRRRELLEFRRVFRLAQGRIQHIQHAIGALHFELGAADSFLLDHIRGHPESGGIDEVHGQTVEVHLLPQHVSGRAGQARDDGDVVPNQSI